MSQSRRQEAFSVDQGLLRCLSFHLLELTLAHRAGLSFLRWSCQRASMIAGAHWVGPSL